MKNVSHELYLNDNDKDDNQSARRRTRSSNAVCQLITDLDFFKWVHGSWKDAKQGIEWFVCVLYIHVNRCAQFFGFLEVGLEFCIDSVQKDFESSTLEL